MSTMCGQVAFCGDICLGKNGIARSHSRAAVRDRLNGIFAGCSLVFANLETPVTGVPGNTEPGKRYCFRADPGELDVLPGNIVLSLANNHVFDQGPNGLPETIHHLNERGIRFSGAGRDLEEAAMPVIADSPGGVCGFIACADSRYSAATNNSPGVFPADRDLLVPAIARLRRQVDDVFVSVHMGMEYTPLPTPSMTRLARECRSAGARVVFFHHAHCVSGHTVDHDGAVLWGTGNFLFPQRADFPFRQWFETAVWKFRMPEGGQRPALRAEPLLIDREGLPGRPSEQAGSSIAARIEGLSRIINSGRHMGWHRVESVLKASYLLVVLSNYADMARRRGIRSVLGQMASSAGTLFRGTRDARR